MIAPNKTGDEKSVEEWEISIIKRLVDTEIFLSEGGTPNEFLGKIMAALGVATTLMCTSYDIIDSETINKIKNTLYLDMTMLLEEVYQNK